MGIAKVHHLVQQLIDDDEVVTDRLFLQLLEVLGEDLDNLVEEQEDLSRIGIALRQGKKIEVVVADVEVLAEKSVFVLKVWQRARVER